MRLIIVDDSNQFRESICFFSEVKLGHEITASYVSPIPLINPEKIIDADIILMDIEMPDMNGIEATKKILRNNHTRKIIAVTNHQEKAYLEDLIRAGFRGCVFKNNIFDELQSALKAVINNRLYFPKNILLSI